MKKKPVEGKQMFIDHDNSTKILSIKNVIFEERSRWRCRTLRTEAMQWTYKAGRRSDNTKKLSVEILKQFC